MYCKIRDKNGFYDEFNIFERLIFTEPCIYFLIQTKEYGNTKKIKGLEMN